MNQGKDLEDYVKKMTEASPGRRRRREAGSWSWPPKLEGQHLEAPLAGIRVQAAQARQCPALRYRGLQEAQRAV